MVAEGCLELGASFAEVDSGLRAQGWQAKGNGCYAWRNSSWQLYFLNDSNPDRLVGAVGRPGRLFFPSEKRLLTEFGAPAVRAALPDRLQRDHAGRLTYGDAVFYPGGDVGLGMHERP